MSEQHGFSASWLKYFACFSMLVDHTAAAFCPLASPWWFFLRGFGRLAFPIFAFLVAEGCHKSRDIRSYAKRLFLFALVAQLPYMMFFRRAAGSVILTFFLAVAAIVLYEDLSEFLPAPAALLVSLFPALIAHWTDADYGAFGVIVVLGLYLCGDNRAAGYVVLIVGLFLKYHNVFFIFAAMALLPLHLYNGRRGQGGKWFFYWFYPVHLLALSLIDIVRYL